MKAVNVAKRTITIALDCEETNAGGQWPYKIVTLPVAPDAKIIYDFAWGGAGKEGKLADLKIGDSVSINLAPVKDQIVVKRVFAAHVP